MLPNEEPRVIKIYGYSKSNISEGIEINRAANEDEWMDDAVNQHISSSLVEELCSLPRTVETKFGSSRDLLERLSADIRQHEQSLGSMSVFIGSWDINRVLDEIVFLSDNSLNLNIEQREGYGDAYICHLEGCVVYNLPYQKNNLSLLVPNFIFSSIEFKEYAERRFVDVAYENIDEETLQLTLVFKYYMKVNFRHGPIYGYMSPDHFDG